MSPPPKYKEETIAAPRVDRKKSTVELMLVAHLHVLPYGGLTRVYVVYANSFPFEISREPKAEWHAEIAPQAYSDEGKKVSRNEHLVLVGLADGGKFIAARNRAGGSGCFIAGVKQGDIFKIAFDEKVTLGAPTGPGTVEIRLTRPPEW